MMVVRGSIQQMEDEFNNLHDRLLNSVNKKLSNLYHSTKSVEILYNILEIAAIGDSIAIGEGVQAVKTKQDMTHCQYIATFQDKGEIARHSHDCLEVIFLQSGFLKDLIDGRTVTKEDPAYIIHEGQIHHITSPQGASVATIIFKKPSV